ncbi:MAG: TonB-dependent receptor plug domain-containing protein [Burkholderiales bacterium]
MRRRVTCIRWATGSIATLLCLQYACAQTTPRSDEDDLASIYGDKSTISLVTGNRQPLRRAPAVATVITAQDIAAMGATDLDEVLESVPGIHVGRNNQGYNPLYIIRGIYSEFNGQTLVLQNGVPMTSMFIGNRGNIWAGFPVSNIARIEIIRGPGSALHGADAYAGVINIVTKSAADMRGSEIGLRVGSFSSREAWAQHGTKWGDVDVGGYLRVEHTDGFKRIVDADAQTQLDGLFGTRASLAPGSINTGREAVDANVEFGLGKARLRVGYKLRDKVGTGAGAASALDPVGQGRAVRGNVDFSWNDIELTPNWKLGLTGSWFYYSNEFPSPLQIFPPGAFGGSFPNGALGAPNTWEKQLRLAVSATYGGWQGHRLRLGLGADDLDMYRTQELKNFTLISSGPITGLPTPTPGAQISEFPVADSFSTPQRRRVVYGYVQDEWSFARDWTLTGGVRHDQYSDFGGTTNPRLAVVWDAGVNLTAKLLYGRAFRAPSFSEQYSINNPVLRGNPALQPEVIGTTEAVLSWQASRDSQIQLSLFKYQMKDIIRATTVAGGTQQYNNAGRQTGHGFELEATQDVSRNLRATAHYAYQRSTDKTSGSDAGYAPHHQLFGRVDWTAPEGWVVTTQFKHVADRARPAGDNRAPIGDYTTVDLLVRTRPRATGWNFSLIARNLFNADVREPSLAPGSSLPNDLPMAGRALTAQAIYKF